MRLSDFTALEPFLTRVGGAVLRYGVVFFLVIYGIFKFAEFEAVAIQPLMAHHPLTFWVMPLFGVRLGAALVGCTEIAIGLLIASRRFAPYLSGLGSLAATGMFLTTLSFLVTTPGLDLKSNDAGFLLKDIALLGAALWSAGEAFSATGTSRN